MALYQDGSQLTHFFDAMFNRTYSPGSIGFYSGIYMCTNCGDEVACNAGNPLPPQNHRQHSPAKGAILWKLLIKTQNRPNS
jgi:hypothetical protein